MRIRHIFFWGLLIASSTGLSGCRLLGFYDYNDWGERVYYEDAGISIPKDIKKKKRRIIPSSSFIEAVKTFRSKNHYFPQDIWSLQNFDDNSRMAFQNMRELGFTELDIAYVHLDSLVIVFTHQPVYNQQIGRTFIRGNDVNGKFIFTVKNDSSFQYIKVLER